MSFFGKLKNLGPPAPPKRIEENAGYGWPDDEFDEEEGDTYEAPPKCDSPTHKVPPRPVEENVYLGLTSNPTISHRQAPPPRPMKIVPMKQQESEEVYIDPSCPKPPEVHRNAKPGKKPAPKKPAAPPMRSVPAPIPAPIPAPPSQYEEDVYLDPNEEQEDSDDVYLEPTDACPPPVRGPMRFPSKPSTDPPPVPKPPVPRANSSAFLMSPDRPGLDVRRSTFPGKLPPPALGSKPPFLTSLKEPKPSPPPPPPPTKDILPAGSPAGLKAGVTPGREDMDWFAGDCDRRTAEDRLQRINKDGAFLVRRSKAQSSGQPYTLAVLYKGKVYNIPIRYLEETRNYALGKEGKKNEEFFSSLQDIVNHHENNQLLLIDSKSQAKHTTFLTHAARR